MDIFDASTIATVTTLCDRMREMKVHPRTLRSLNEEVGPTQRYEVLPEYGHTRFIQGVRVDLGSITLEHLEDAMHRSIVFVDAGLDLHRALLDKKERKEFDVQRDSLFRENGYFYFKAFAGLYPDIRLKALEKGADALIYFKPWNNKREEFGGITYTVYKGVPVRRVG
jgi:hypothetical protein